MWVLAWLHVGIDPSRSSCLLQQYMYVYASGCLAIECACVDVRCDEVWLPVGLLNFQGVHVIAARRAELSIKFSSCSNKCRWDIKCTWTLQNHFQRGSCEGVTVSY